MRQHRWTPQKHIYIHVPAKNVTLKCDIVFSRDSIVLKASQLAIVEVFRSVCVFVTHTLGLAYIKTVQATCSSARRITKSSLWAVIKTIVFCDKNQCHGYSAGNFRLFLKLFLIFSFKCIFQFYCMIEYWLHPPAQSRRRPVLCRSVLINFFRDV